MATPRKHFFCSWTLSSSAFFDKTFMLRVFSISPLKIQNKHWQRKQVGNKIFILQEGKTLWKSLLIRGIKHKRNFTNREVIAVGFSLKQRGLRNIENNRKCRICLNDSCRRGERKFLPAFSNNTKNISRWLLLKNS